jgi:hypothetical protein
MSVSNAKIGNDGSFNPLFGAHHICDHVSGGTLHGEISGDSSGLSLNADRGGNSVKTAQVRRPSRPYPHAASRRAETATKARARSLTLALALTACAQQAPVDLGVALQGIEKSRFLSCSGPPSLEEVVGDQDRMSFVTNLKQGASIGIQSPVAVAPASCSVNAVFVNSRLAHATFFANQTMCQFVFDPCLPK